MLYNFTKIKPILTRKTGKYFKFLTITLKKFGMKLQIKMII
jgi:hypothetical protein